MGGVQRWQEALHYTEHNSNPFTNHDLAKHLGVTSEQASGFMCTLIKFGYATRLKRGLFMRTLKAKNLEPTVGIETESTPGTAPTPDFKWGIVAREMHNPVPEGKATNVVVPLKPNRTDVLEVLGLLLPDMTAQGSVPIKALGLVADWLNVTDKLLAEIYD